MFFVLLNLIHHCMRVIFVFYKLCHKLCDQNWVGASVLGDHRPLLDLVSNPKFTDYPEVLQSHFCLDPNQL